VGATKLSCEFVRTTYFKVDFGDGNVWALTLMPVFQLNKILTSANARKEILYMSTVKFKAVPPFANHKVISCM
jgi:hypothetical protein